MVYLDNSATSWPKPNRVYRAMYDFMRTSAANPGRSGHRMAVKSSETVYKCREIVSDMFNVANPGNVIFTVNTTYALNTAIKGVLKEGDHAVCTCMEHNSVLRPLESLKVRGIITYDTVKADSTGYVSPSDIENAIRGNTRCVIVNHVSNVCGTIQSIAEIGRVCKKHKVYFIVDGAQSGGILPIDMVKNNISMLALAGHKGLMGPMGTGILCIADGLMPQTFCEGGTGSYSKDLIQPQELPDRFEAGTLNAVGICGLLEGLKYISVVGTDNIYAHEMELTKRFITGLNNIKRVKIYGINGFENRTGVVAVNIDGMDCINAAQQLNDKYSIAVRSGYHCAYPAHMAIGSGDGGAIRFSFGAFNTVDDVNRALFAINHIT